MRLFVLKNALKMSETKWKKKDAKLCTDQSAMHTTKLIPFEGSPNRQNEDVLLYKSVQEQQVFTLCRGELLQCFPEWFSLHYQLITPFNKKFVPNCTKTLFFL